LGEFLLPVTRRALVGILKESRLSMAEMSIVREVLDWRIGGVDSPGQAQETPKTWEYPRAT
jgi:hypothetical protein